MNFESFKQDTGTVEKSNLNFDNKMATPSCPCAADANACCNPIYECPKENICHRYIYYEVPQE